jgi:mono/diheme cytochrome c family protein
VTEVPEHLLQKAREARARLTGEGGDAPADSGAASSAGSSVEKAPAAAPAPVAAAAPAIVEKAPEPVPPFVQAALDRKKVPSWAFFIVMLLPIWGFFYVGTLEAPAKGGVFEAGASVYGSCAGCHGAGGAGGTGRPLTGGEVIATFPDAASHVWWVVNGSPTNAGTPFGDPARAGGQRVALGFNGGGMPGFGDSLTAAEILEVVYYERVEHGGQDTGDIDLVALEELIEAGELFELPESFAEGTTIEEIQEFINKAVEELGL